MACMLQSDFVRDLGAFFCLDCLYSAAALGPCLKYVRSSFAVLVKDVVTGPIIGLG
jgi:hypothetical protein